MSHTATDWLRIYFTDDASAYTTLPCTHTTTASAICASLMKKRGVANTTTAATASSFSSQPTHALYITDVMHHHVYERQLDPNEYPLEVQEKSRKEGNLDHFKILFRPCQATSSEADDTVAIPHLDFEESSSTSVQHQAPQTPSSAATLAASSSYNGTPQQQQQRTPSTPSSAAQQHHYPSSYTSHDSSQLHCGYLEKRGKRNTAWKERWFILKPSGLHYYKNHTSIAIGAIGTITFNDVFIKACHTNCQSTRCLPFIAAPSTTNLTLSPSIPTPHSHSSLQRCSYEFEIHTILRVFYLRARNYPDMIHWINSIQTQIPRCLDNNIIDDLDQTICQSEYQNSQSESNRIQSISTLSGLLSNAIAIEQFVQFETERNNERLVLAYLEMDGYTRNSMQGTKTRAQLIQRAQGIYDNFISSPTSTQYIHVIPSEYKTQIRDILASGAITSQLFQQIQSFLFDYLSDHSFHAFIVSKHFQRAIIKLAVLGDVAMNNAQRNDGATAAKSLDYNGSGMHIRFRPQSITHPMPTTGATVIPRVAASNTTVASPTATQSPNPVVAPTPLIIDESHSITSLPSPPTTVPASLLAYAGSFIASSPTTSSSSSPPSTSPTSQHHHTRHPQVNGSSTTVSLNGTQQQLTPRSLARYLESIGQDDAKQRVSAASLSQAAAPNASPNANASDSEDESAEEIEEEGIFSVGSAASGTSSAGGNKASVDDVSLLNSNSNESFSSPVTRPKKNDLFTSPDDDISPSQKKQNGTSSSNKRAPNEPNTNGLGSQGTSSVSSPSFSSTSIGTPLTTADDLDAEFTQLSRTRSVAHTMYSPTAPHSVLLPSSHSKNQSSGSGGAFGSLSPTASSVPPEVARTRSRLDNASDSPITTQSDATMPAENRRRTVALGASDVLPQPLTSLGPSAIPVNSSTSSSSSASKKKKHGSASIFDADDDDDDDPEFASLLAAPPRSRHTATHAPPPPSQSFSSSSSITTTTTTSNTPTAATTKQQTFTALTSSSVADMGEAVDLGDLNLDEEPEEEEEEEANEIF